MREQEIKRIYERIKKDYRMRFYPKQKASFREYIMCEFQDLGFEQIEVDDAGNVIVGDVGRAIKVYSAHYDTPMLSFYVTPFTRIFGHLAGSVVAAFALVFILLLTSTVLYMFMNGSFAAVAVVLGLFALMHAFPNPNNANDNTSGVLSVLTTAMILKQKQKLDRVAFILFNSEELGLLGSNKFEAAYKRKYNYPPSFILYNYDCTGVGKRILIMSKSPPAKNAADNIDKQIIKAEGKGAIRKNTSILFASDHLCFKNGIMICCVKRSLLGAVYLPNVHMPSDERIDLEQIDRVCSYVTA